MSGGDTGYRHCTVGSTLTVQTVDIRTVEFSLLLEPEGFKLNLSVGRRRRTKFLFSPTKPTIEILSNKTIKHTVHAEEK
jgi:hypothetical protein